MGRVLSILISVALLVGCAANGIRVVEPGHIGAPASHSQVNLLAMGDWGTGSAAQKRVANALSDYVESFDMQFDGMLLAGDNFYVKLGGTHDPQWQTLFEQMYDPDVLDFPFFVALGNHDYENGKDEIELAYARENPNSRWKLPSRWYRIDFPRIDPLVTVFMLDSDKDLMPSQHWQAQLDWLREQLARNDLGRWVVCCAHHPMFSNGDHGDIGQLQKVWGRLFEQHGVDFYICGHDHDLQHLRIPGWEMTFILCGGGGAGVRAMRSDSRGHFSRSLHGFVHLSFTRDSVTVKFINADGHLVHHFQRHATGAESVFETTGRDGAWPRTVKSITRPDATTQPATVPTLGSQED